MSNGSECGPIAASLAAVFDRFELIERLTPGTGGASFLIEAEGRRYVAKHFAADRGVLLEPARQFELLGVLAEAGIAPAPRAFDAGARLLVVEFAVGAASLPPSALRAERTVAAVADLLKRLHAVAFELPAFRPDDCGARYVDRIGGRPALSRDERRRFDELLDLARVPLPCGTCPCHNDLTADNILFGERPVLIDFDYAAAASPLLDLASCSVMNGFSAVDTARLLERYFGGPPPFGREEFARVQRLVRLLAHFWALAAASDTEVLSKFRIEND